MLHKAVFFLFIFNLFIHGNFSMSGNQHLLEAFLRSGDLNQAEKFIKAFPSEDLEFVTLRSVVAYCQSKEGAFQDLQEYWPQVSKTFKRRVSRHLITCLSEKDPEYLNVKQLSKLFEDSITSAKYYRDFFLNSLKVLGEFEEIRKYQGPLDSILIIEAYVQAHSEAQYKKYLVDRLLEVPLNNGAVVQKVLQSFIERNEDDIAMKLFEKIRSRPQPWVANIYIYLGQELNDSQLVIEGYRRKINFNQLNFESYRGLATHYFKTGNMRSGDEVLLKYLRKFPHKYQGAKEIAQVLIDFGRFEELMMFINNMRRQLKDDRAFIDVVLYAYSIKAKPNDFLKELFRVDPSINPHNWARKIVDSFQLKFIAEVYNEFKKSFAKLSSTNLKLLIKMVEYSKVELGEWVDDEFSSFASDEVEIEVQRLLKRSRYEIAERLLRAVKKRTSGLSKQEKNLFGQVLYRMGQYQEAYSYLESMAENYDGDGELYFFLVTISARTKIWRQFLLEWLEKLKSSPFWKKLSRVDKDFVHYTYMEQQIFETGKQPKVDQSSFNSTLDSEEKLVLQIIEDLLNSDKITPDGTLKRMKSFLNSELSAVKYPLVQHLYLQVIDLKSFHAENFWKNFLGVIRAGFSGQIDILDDQLSRLEASIKDHHAEILFRETLLAHRCLLLHRSVYRETNSKLYQSQLIQWENVVSKLFEQFPQSLYTPMVMEQLVLYLEARDLRDRRDQWIRRYMLKYSSDLLAQKFRNKLL